MRRRLRWDEHRAEKPPLAHPYRDTALVYLAFAVVIVIVAVATGGGFPKAVVIAALFWLLATTAGVLSLRRKRKLR